MNFRAKRWFELADRYSLSVGGASLLLCVAAGVWPAMRASFFQRMAFRMAFLACDFSGRDGSDDDASSNRRRLGRADPPHHHLPAQVLPVLFLLFLPIFLGMSILFPWARTSEPAGDPILMHAHAYLNPLFSSFDSCSISSSGSQCRGA